MFEFSKECKKNRQWMSNAFRLSLKKIKKGINRANTTITQ